MRLTAEENDVLRECHRRQAEIEATPEPAACKEWKRRELIELKTYGPRYACGDWFGGEQRYVPEKYRVRYLRAVYSLEERGLLIVSKLGGRLANVKLSDAGMKLADELNAAEPAPTRKPG